MTDILANVATLALAGALVSIAHFRAKSINATTSSTTSSTTSILISPVSSYSNKKDTIIKNGFTNLHLVLDFDRTMTSFFGPRGRKGATCHGIVESRRSPELKARAESLNAIFYPIEVDPTRSLESKLPWMRSWYALVNEILIESGITKFDIIEDVKQANCSLRKGIVDILDWAKEKSVPVTIFSAGLGDVISEVLEQQWLKPLPKNIKIISNMMIFDKVDGKLVGFSDPLIHMFNKTMKFHENNEDFKELSSRKNIILLGDSTADISMADGLDADTVLRVGFLNDNVKTLAETYMSIYDIVLINDSPSTIVLDILHQM
jgi:cytosolic 5'-nucleotidase 3